MTRIAVCICTYKRPEGLAKLLKSLAELTHVQPDVIVVVDNHAAGEGAAVCTSVATHYPYPIVHAIEPKAGISFARNKAVALALEQNPDLIAFLDDDEWPENNWLSELTRVLNETNADAVGGPTRSVFPPHSDEALTSNPYYGADMSVADGATCQLQAAGNFIIKASTIEAMGPAFFREEFAQSGGEDLAFFTTLAQNNKSMTWANNAIVHENVPANRLTREWLKGRIIGIANSRVRVMQILEPGIAPASIRAAKTIALFCQATLWSALGLISAKQKEQAEMLRWKFTGKLRAHLRQHTIREEGH